MARRSSLRYRFVMRRFFLLVLAVAACQEKTAPPPPAPLSPTNAPPVPILSAWEKESPLAKLPALVKGLQADFAKVTGVTPEKVRLGRWLFFDKRLSADNTVACASCHRPENAF